jgi:hypothetical protein
MKKYFSNKKYRKTTIGILIFTIILIYSIRQANYSVQIDDFSLSLVYYEGGESEKSYLIEIEPNRIRFYNTKLQSSPAFINYNSSLFCQIYKEKERKVSDQQMYYIVKMFQNVNLYANDDDMFSGYAEEILWSVDIYADNKRYPITYRDEKDNDGLKSFMDMLMRYASDPDFTIPTVEHTVS